MVLPFVHLDSPVAKKIYKNFSPETFAVKLNLRVAAVKSLLSRVQLNV